jgi:putative Holliday junction resolvase
MRGRRIAFDYGDVRIGVAVSDPDGILASPLTTLQAQGSSLLAQIKEIFDEYEPVKIFVGEPKHMSGERGESSTKASLFGNLLTSNFSVEVTYVDERLSSVSASRKLKDAGLTTRESKQVIDAMAAVAILEQGLAIEKNS